MGNCKSKKKAIIRTGDDNSLIITNVKPDYKKNLKHLICDDAYTNRLVLKKYLIMYGCEVDEAENGEDAINKVKTNGEYQIIWMDIKMPKMDGFECTYQLRNTLAYTGRIIGLTGYVDETTIKKCKDVGMEHVIAKPFDKNTINDFVRSA